MKASEESTKDQLALARKQGEAYAAAVEAMNKESGAYHQARFGTREQPFIWHPWLYHCGLNWEVPGEGMHVRIDPPAFMRHSHENGKRYAEAVEVEFDRHIKPGQKRAT